MPIVNFKVPYIPRLYDIDIKSYLWPWTEEGWERIEGYVIRVYLLNDKVVGFCSFRSKGNKIIVSKLCVHPNSRNLGVGAALHDDLVKKYRKKTLEMTLHEENEFFDFLIKRGWRATSISKELFPDNLDGYVFIKEIK